MAPPVVDGSDRQAMPRESTEWRFEPRGVRIALPAAPGELPLVEGAGESLGLDRNQSLAGRRVRA